MERTDPTLGEDPKVSGIEVFYADDGWIAYFKPVGAVGLSKSSEIGSVEGGRCVSRLEDDSRTSSVTGS